MNFLQKKYVSSLLITLGIFVLVFTFVGRLNRDRVQHLASLQQQMAIDLMAVETQFNLLKTAPCSLMTRNVLSRELGEIGAKLDFALQKQGSTNTEILNLKKHYSLLQVKDYLLVQELANKCDIEVDSLLYFYTNDCSDCRKQGYILTDFKLQYPDIRIYSFDMDMDFPVITTFASLYDLNDSYPVIVVDDNVHAGLQTQANLSSIFKDALERYAEQERIEQGKDFIRNAEDYQGEETTNIELVEQTDTSYRYEYQIKRDTRVTTITTTLYFDTESQTFSDTQDF